MKVLMVNTPQAPGMAGGDLAQMRCAARELRALGVEVAENFDLRPDARGFDLAHVFNIRTLGATFRQVEQLRRQNVPIVLSPVYLNPSFALWGTRAVEQIFHPGASPGDVERQLEALRTRRFIVRGPNGQEWRADTQNRPRPDYDELQRRIVLSVDHLLPNSILEMHALQTTLGIYGIPFAVVPYGADPQVFNSPGPEPFVRQYGLRDFVLQVGRIERPKNQLMLSYALRGCDLPLVLIGKQMQPKYLAACREFGPKHLMVIEHLPPDMLASAYAAARVHALPSWVETCGLVTLEAVLADCSVVVSTAGYELEYFGRFAHYCDPADVDSIREAVLDAYKMRCSHATQREELRERILRDFHWRAAAHTTMQGYDAALVKRNRRATCVVPDRHSE